MTIYFGENIKKLRKEKELTQETLAEFLGVSFQAVSKWERGETYPDIALLPVIARFFDTSIDELLGVNKSRGEEQINKYLKLYDEMKLKDLSLTFNEFQKAVKEFPRDYRILVCYMELLQEFRGFVKGGYKDITKEITSIYENIQNYCTEDSIRIRSKVIMISHLLSKYQCVPDDEGKYYVYDEFLKQAEEIINTLPSMKDSKELHLMGLSYDSKAYYETHKNVLEEILFIFQEIAFGYCFKYEPEKRLEIFTYIQGLINSIFPDGDYGKNCINRLYNYGHMGYLYHQIGDDTNALYNLRIAAKYAKELDENPDILEKVMRHYNFGPVFRETNLSQFMKFVMTEHYLLSDEFKSKPEFQEIIKMLE